MNDCAVRPGARDRVEADVLQRVVFGTERLELLHGFNLGQASRPVLVEPAQEPDHRDAVADVRLAKALDLGLVLDATRQD